jgi:cytoskeletal protein CcmA (bactofilin family)
MPMLKPEGSGSMAPSIIAEDLTITGNIISKGEVQIEGDVQGDVFCSNLIIGDRGRVTGAIVAEEVTVHGRISGSVNALHVTLESNSHVEGDICHQALKLEHGAFFEGQSRRSDDPLSSAATNLDAFKQATTPPGMNVNKLRATRIERAA